MPFNELYVLTSRVDDRVGDGHMRFPRIVKAAVDYDGGAQGE
jgi:hypothetical protein